MDKATARIALRELRKLKRIEAEYREDVEAWYQSGDGRSPRYWTDPETGRTHNYGGKGYTYPYCEHGSSRWTDYDNICGPCEDGYSVYQLALFRANDLMWEVNRRIKWLMDAPNTLPVEKHWELVEWAMEPIKEQQ